MNKSTQINRGKASSHPLKSGGVYIGFVKAFVDSRATVEVPQLGCVFKNVEFINNTTRTVLAKNDRVLCTFIDLETSELFIIGAFNKKQDTFTGKEKFNLLIDVLQSEINTLRAAVSLSNTDLNLYKQTD